MKITAPWDAETVAELNQYQASEQFHPYTCGGDRSDEAHRVYAVEHNQSDHGILVATESGWVCPVCNYTQDWALDFKA